MAEFYFVDNTTETDAATLGIRMGDGFMESLRQPLPMKEFVMNESRLEHGKRYVIRNPKIDSRSITLTFVILGDTRAEYEGRRAAFYQRLYNGTVILKVGDEYYGLVYTGKNVSFAEPYSRTSCKVSVGFDEPNPMCRTLEAVKAEL